MKNKHLLLAVALVFAVGTMAFGQVRPEGKIKPKADGTQSVRDLDPQNAANYVSARRVNQYTGTIDVADIIRAQEQVRALHRKAGNSLNMMWNELGPNNIGGRTRAILLDKDNPDVVLAGSVSGGLWRSTSAGSSWQKTTTGSGQLFENLAVSSICQAANGDIYFGTGEGAAVTEGNPQNSHQGILGQGIWKSTDRGLTFNRLTSTWDEPTAQETFILVYAMAADPVDANKIFVATVKGLRLSTDGGQSWVNPIADITLPAYDVKVASDGTVIACVGQMAYRSENGAPGTFTKISSATGLEENLILDANVSRMMFAFAPSDPNFVYCIAAGISGTDYPLSNIYQSKDKGLTWSVIGPGGSSYFNPLGTEGNYALAIAVDPANPEFIMIGGKDLYSWSFATNWEKITIDEPTDLPNRGFYVHRDQHIILFNPANPNSVFVGTSGGVAVSDNRGTTWRTINRNYNVTQFFSVAYSPTGEVLGGSMDNGILYMDFQGNDPKYATWWGGAFLAQFLSFRHGGEADISMLDPDFKFYTTPGGTVHRRLLIENQSTYQNYYTYANGGAWLSPIALHETLYDPLSWDTVNFVADRDYSAGETIVAQSMIRKLPIRRVLEADLTAGDTLKVQDTYQAMLVVGKQGKASAKVNRHPLNGRDEYTNQFHTVIKRDRLEEQDQLVKVEFSADGKNLFAALWDNSDSLYYMYRVTNLENGRDRRTMDTDAWDPATGLPTAVVETALIGAFDQVVTSIAIDHNNANNVLVTCGNYGNDNYIYLCRNALTAADSVNSFVPVQGNLPQAPVYTSLFNWRNSSEVIVGTEYGVYSTANIFAPTPTWASENNNGMEILPVYEIRQQKFANNPELGVTNHGVIYAATFGRGLYTSNTFESKGGSTFTNPIVASNIEVNITPNPVSDVATIRYSIENDSPVLFQVYNLQGQLVKNINLGNQPAGSNEMSFDSSDLGSGTFLIRMNAGNQQTTSKFVVR